MKKALTALTAFLMILAATAAMGQGKTTVDPNAAGSTAQQDTEKADPRLAQKITYEAKSKTVLAILADLSEKTGVEFKAGQNSKDWQVRDRKMNVFATDATVVSLMNSIARVMKFKWSHEGKEGEYVYRLYMDRKTLLDTEAKLAREEERVRKMKADKRAKAFQLYADAATVGPAQAEKFKETNPFLYVIAKGGVSNSLGQFFGEAPLLTEAFTTGQTMSLTGADLSPAAQQSMLRSMQDMWRMEQSMSGGNKPFPDDFGNNLDKVSIRVNRHLDEMQGLDQAGFMLGEMEMSYGGHNIGVPLIDPESNMAKLIGKMLIQSMDEGKPIQDIGKDRQAEFVAAITKDMKSSQGDEATVEHPDDLALHAKIKLKVERPMLVNVEQALAKATGLAVVSDSFGSIWDMGAMAKFGEAEEEIRTILDKIEDSYRYDWEKHGSTIEFRDKQWYRKRAAQIPEAWIEGWRDTLKKTGTLDIGDLSQIAVLTQEQLQVNIMSDEIFQRSNMFGSIFSSREPLRLYAQMTDAQRSAVFSEAGLDLRSLGQQQWQQVKKLVEARDASMLKSENAQIILAGTRTAKDKRFEYKFTVTSSEESKPIEWQFTTPVYVEPKPEPKKEEAKPADPAAKPAAAQ